MNLEIGLTDNCSHLAVKKVKYRLTAFVLAVYEILDNNSRILAESQDAFINKKQFDF